VSIEIIGMVGAKDVCESRGSFDARRSTPVT